MKKEIRVNVDNTTTSVRFLKYN